MGFDHKATYCSHGIVPLVSTNLNTKATVYLFFLFYFTRGII